MERRRPKEALRDGAGYRLETRIRERFDTCYGQRTATVDIQNLLSDLPTKVSTLAEKTYLEEALICLRHKAFRAAIVMCWNLAYDHLRTFVLAGHAAAFNVQLPKSFPKDRFPPIVSRDDFENLKESQTLLVCKSAGIISGSVYKVMKEKLDRRNVAAHPSGVTVSQLTAEEFIKDLTENVVLKLI